MITCAFSRCNSGHYFMGEYCPFDGWSSIASKELAAAVKRLEKKGSKVSLEELRKIGVSDDTIARTIIIQFGAESSAFEAISPEYVVVNGETITIENLNENFT